MSELLVGSKIIYSGLTDLVVTELVDHFPEEIAKLKRIVDGENETDPMLLSAHLENDFAEADLELLARGWRSAARDERRAIAVEVVALFPDAVEIIQKTIRDRAPKKIESLAAGAIARFKNSEYHLKCRVSDLTDSADGWTLPGTMRYPVVGERISHHSEEELLIESIDGLIAKFKTQLDKEGRAKDVSCRVEDLVWLDEDSAWYLPGRLLSKADRQRWSVIAGSPFPPPPDQHVEARKLLRASN